MPDPRVDGLLRLLHGHRPADLEEARHLRRIVALLDASPRPFDRDAVHPGHVTASGFVLDPGRERLLLIHHRNLGIWIQPGGHIDAADSGPDAAARREVAEETGVAGLEPIGEGLLDVDVHRYPARSRTPAHDHFDVRFAYAARSARLAAGDEVHDARWVPAAGLGQLAVDRSILRPAGKLFATL